LLPVEGVEDLCERKLDRQLPLKQEMLICEDEKPRGFSPGEMSRFNLSEGSRDGLLLSLSFT